MGSEEALLELYDLGIGRFLSKLNELLEAEHTRYYQDECLGNFTDNRTRVLALKILADFLSQFKTESDPVADSISTWAESIRNVTPQCLGLPDNTEEPGNNADA